MAQAHPIAITIRRAPARQPRDARCAGRAAALLTAALSLALAGCGGGTRMRPVSDVPVRIGPAYTVRGTTYVPRAQPGYDVLGYATWYGPESGSRTASGEKFRPDGISGAHTTLPLPTYVEVTDLESGRRIVIRVNDRGPFGDPRLVLDLSRGAAELLGVRAKGRVAVRIRAVDPSAKDKARLRAGKPAAALAPLDARRLDNLRAQFACGVGPR